MSVLKKILTYPLSIIHYFFFGLVLIIFHPIQWVAFNVFGYKAHKKTVSFLNFFVTGTLYLLGSRVVFNNPHQLPKDVPLILVANHQSTYDIPPIFWFLRQYHPKFVSKMELGHGIPSVSYNLRHGGSVLINRKDARQSLKALSDFGAYIEQNNYMAAIFPEGTRSKDGHPKAFKDKGLKIMLKKAPSAYIVPVSINNSWKLVRFGNFPLGIGVKLTFDVHEPIKAASMPFDELFALTEKTVKNGIHV